MTTKAHAVIMAGGAGTRFWPLSRARRPKQLLPLAGGETSLLALSLERFAELIPGERTLVVTGAAIADDVAQVLPSVPRQNILVEPTGRNTAACIGWAASVIARSDPSAVMVVLPADHHIANTDEFRRILSRAIEYAATGRIVTIGIQPTRPETGYGYIELREALDADASLATRFVEKPSRERAQEFLKAKNFVWNSGMFVMRADVVLREIKAHLPALAEGLVKLDAAAREGTEADEVISTYHSLPSISIDHGIMEKQKDIIVLRGDFGWSDVGGFATAWELAPKDENGNATIGDAIALDSLGCYVRAEGGRIVAVLGARDMVVIDTPDATLVVPRDASDRVKEIVDALKKRDRSTLT